MRASQSVNPATGWGRGEPSRSRLVAADASSVGDDMKRWRLEDAARSSVAGRGAGSFATHGDGNRAISEEDILLEEESFRRRYGTGTRRRVLLLGGGGYIGVPVAAELLRGGLFVRNADAFIYGNQASVTGLLLDPRYECRCADLRDEVALRDALSDVTDVVILAGLVGDPITRKYPDASRSVNVDGMRRCLDLLRDYDLNKVVFVSTCSNYGVVAEGRLATEETQLRPLSTYAEAKVAAEETLMAQKGRVRHHATVLRFATAFGAAPRMRFDLSVNEFTRDLLRGGEALEVYDPDTWRPYCHVRDFARLIRLVLEAPAARTSFEIFNAGGDDNNRTKRQIVDEILCCVPSREIRYREHGADPRNYRVDFTKVRDRLGFVPSHSVRDGIREVVSLLKAGFFGDYNSNRNYYGNYTVLDDSPRCA